MRKYVLDMNCRDVLLRVRLEAYMGWFDEADVLVGHGPSTSVPVYQLWISG
jgi:hypothetical protein